MDNNFRADLNALPKTCSSQVSQGLQETVLKLTPICFLESLPRMKNLEMCFLPEDYGNLPLSRKNVLVRQLQKTRLKKGLFMEDQSSRVPCRYTEDHPDAEWLKLKKFVIMKKLSMKEFTSPKLSDSVIKDYKQALRLNALLEKALQGDW